MAIDPAQLQVQDPAKLVKRPALPTPAQGMEQLGGILGQITGGLAQIQDPFIREIARDYVSAEIGRVTRNPGYKLPTAEQAEADKAQALLDTLKMNREVQAEYVMLGESMVLDLSEEDKARLGLAGLTDPRHEAPEKFVAALRQLNVPVTRGSLRMADKQAEISDEAVAAEKAQEAQQAQDEELTRRARMGREMVSITETTGQLAETAAATGKGEGPLGTILQTSVAAQEQAFGADLSSSILGPDTDLDEPKGSAAAVAAMRQSMGQVPAAMRPLLAEGFLSRFKGDLTDNLEGLATNDKGELVIGVGDSGIDPEATFNLAGMIMGLSSAVGDSDVGATMRDRLGLPYSGIDLNSFTQYALTKSGGDAQKARELIEGGFNLAVRAR